MCKLWGGGSGKCVCTGGDQTACVPTLASMGTREFESWSIIWGKKDCIISPRWGAVCRARCVQGECVRQWHLVISRDLSRLSPQPADCLVQGKVRSEGRAPCGTRSGRRVHMGARWVEGG